MTKSLWSLPLLLTVALSLSISIEPIFAQSDKFHGVSYGSGSYTNPQEIPPPFHSLERDMNQLEKITDNLRIFGLPETQEKITQLADKRGIPVYLSVYLGDDVNKIDGSVDEIIRIANENQNVKGIIFDGMRVDRDIEKISTLIGLVDQSVRDGVFVTISVSYDTWIGNPTLANAVDVIFLKSHQYWQGYSVDDAISVAFDQREQLEQIIQDKQVILEEHGWPSSGSVIQCAEPSAKAQSYFVKEFVKRANSESIPYFLFSAYDEPWKPTIEPDMSLIVEKSCLKEDVIETGENAEHNWGLFQTNRVIKPELIGIILPIIDQHIEKPEMLILKEIGSSKVISPNIQSDYNNGDVLQADLNNLKEDYQSVSIYNDGKLVETFDDITTDTKLLLRSNDSVGFNKVTLQTNKQSNDNPLLFLLPNAFAEEETNTFPIEFLVLPDGFATCNVEQESSCYHVNVDKTQFEFPLWILGFLGLVGLIPLFLKRCKKRYGKPVIEKAPTTVIAV
ncbi:MAG: hypothetical protein ACR2LL_12115 [Nitrosopumilus sp.]